MSVRVTEVRPGRWQVDIRGRFPDGTRYRDRRRPEEEWVKSRTAALTWGRDRERALYDRWRAGPTKERPAVPTLAEFAPRYVEESARADRQKPSTIAWKETTIRAHLLPVLGSMRLDEIRSEDVQRLKTKLAAGGAGAKTTNNTLTVLSKLLKVAEEWGVIEALPCRIKPVRFPKPGFRFLDFEEYARLVDAARKVSPEAHLVVLLGGRAGLRTGELRSLRWEDADFKRRRLVVSRSDWHGQITATKSGRSRIVPMTDELHAALQAHRHLRGELVLYRQGERMLTERSVEHLLESASRVAGLPCVRPHVLRHSFISHLAMRGVPVRTIQEYAGHADLTTTMRYMHLSPAHRDSAIHVLEPAGGNVGATEGTASSNIVEAL